MKTMQKWLLGGKFYKFLIKEEGEEEEEEKKKKKRQVSMFKLEG